MKRFLLILTMVLLGLGGAVLVLRGAGGQRPVDSSVMPGEALVQFRSGISGAQAEQLISQAGVTLKERIDPQQIYVVSFSRSISPEEVVHRFRAMPQVLHAEPNGIYELNGSDWFVSEAYAEDGPLGAGAKVRVAVIDTAIDGNHPALAGKVVSGYNFVNNTTSTQSAGIGQDWHGTASSGRILDGAGGANIELMPVQVFGSSGGASWSTIIKAINYAVDNGAQVINMSLGGMAGSPLVQQAIDRATEKGILVVASAGNHGTEAPAYPASYNGVLSVAASNEAGRKAGFSAYGSTVDLTAPGDTMKLLSHGGTRMSQGTSFSAPFITGMLALLKSAFPSLTAGQAEEVLKSKARPLSDMNNPRYDGKLGAGLLNALDVARWVEEIRAGTFQFPWQQAVPPVVPPPAVRPPVQAPSNQPWLVRGRGHSGNYVVTPAGEVVKE
ncbi:MAG: S8 family serine peptidase [Candidatus Omnitrophica bacterium]|nr:S8 family serine peptidase [Candidatus Omnitrophota bacterium]